MKHMVFCRTHTRRVHLSGDWAGCAGCRVRVRVRGARGGGGVRGWGGVGWGEGGWGGVRGEGWGWGVRGGVCRTRPHTPHPAPD